MPRFAPRSRVFLVLVQLLLLVLVTAAIPIAKAPVSDNGDEKQYLTSDTSQNEASTTDIDSGGELPGLLPALAFSVEKPSTPLFDKLAAQFAPVVVIYHATRAPPSV